MTETATDYLSRSIPSAEDVERVVLSRLSAFTRNLLVQATLLEQMCKQNSPTVVCKSAHRVVKATKDLQHTLEDPRPPQVRWRESCLAKGLCCRCGSHKIAEGRSNKLCRGCLNKLRDNMRARRERATAQ